VEEYFSEIGMTRPDIERAKEAIALCQSVYDAPIMDVFVTDFVDPSGRRTYNNIWLIRENSVSEIKSFLTSSIFDYTPDLKIEYAEWKLFDYDLKNFNDSSKLIVDMHVVYNMVLSFSAVRNNCHTLRDLVKKYFPSR